MLNCDCYGNTTSQCTTKLSTTAIPRCKTAGIKNYFYNSFSKASLGKVYYELVTARDFKKLTDQIAISRIEQLNPFPYDLVAEECAKYDKAELVWVQEEHKNMGAWKFVKPRVEEVDKRFVRF